MEEETLNEVLRKFNLLLDEKNGLKLSGQGIICNNTEKANEILDKSQKFLYFLENRQKIMQEQNNEILNILQQIRDKLK